MSELTLEEAKRLRRCRVCGEPISVDGCPIGFEEEFGERLFPLPAVTFDFGKEFSHTVCLAVESSAWEERCG